MKNDSPQAQRGYQRRPCSKCGEDLSFSESDPCDKCADTEPQAQPPERIWIEPTPHGHWLVWLDGQARGVEYVRANLPRAAADDELTAVLIAIRDCKNDTKCSVCASIIRHALIRAKSRAEKGGSQ